MAAHVQYMHTKTLWNSHPSLGKDVAALIIFKKILNAAFQKIVLQENYVFL